MEEKRKLASIVFTDIKGYTAMMESNEAIALSTVERFEKFTRETSSKYNGEVINFMGDGALLIFENSTDAIDFAIDIQTRFIVEEKIQHRIGINTGEVIFKDGNVYGDSVNVAARIESLGLPGVVLISESTNNLIKNKKKFAVKSMGKFHFKNKKDLMEVFAVVNEPLTIPQRKDLKGKTEESKINKWWLLSSVASIVLLVIALFYFSNMASSVQSKTWEGSWEIDYRDENKNFKEGELKIDQVGDELKGSATIWYNDAHDVSLETTLKNIVKKPDDKTLAGNWETNLLGTDALKGKFELRMMPSYNQFEGYFYLVDGKESFQWKGKRQ